MKIFGIGTDIVPVQRLRKIALREEQAMLARLFTEVEAEELRAIQAPAKRYQAYAASFAIKESMYKALGTGLIEGMSWRDVEISDIFGKCRMQTFGKTQRLCQQHNIIDCKITCSATDELATALLILITQD